MSNLKINREVRINAPIDKVFDFLVTPNKIPLLMPGLIENANISELPLRTGSSFHYKYQMYGVILEGTWTVTDIKAHTKYYAKTDGDIISYWYYNLIENNGNTVIKFEIEYEIPESVLANLKTNVIKTINERETDHFFDNLTTVLEM